LAKTLKRFRKYNKFDHMRANHTIGRRSSHTPLGSFSPKRKNLEEEPYP
jgi:hypothetical protein